ncbi:MAG: hypothetical protein ACLUHE_17380 [Christensenellales bacterium]
MSHVTAGFEYDETLGRLQFVSNILPESAMVFLEGGDDAQTCASILPTETKLLHAWSADEIRGWNTRGTGEMSCCMAGEVMNTVRNRRQARVYAGAYSQHPKRL